MSDGTGEDRTDAAGSVPPPVSPPVPQPTPPPVTSEPVVPPPVASAPPTAVPVDPEPVLPPPPAAGAVADTHLAPPIGHEPAAVAPMPAPVLAEPDAADQQWPSDAAPSPYIGGSAPASGSYRLLTAVIVLFLAALLAGAIALIVYLAGHTALPFPSAGPEPEPVETTQTLPSASAPPSDVPVTEVVALTGDACSDFCLDVANRVGATVVGADGQSTWTVSRAWTTAEVSVVDAEEVVGADYRSDAGELTFIVWRFSDDASAQAAQERIASSLGDPIDSGAAFDDGTGEQSTFADGSLRTIVWSKLGDGGQPWVMEVYGADVDAVQQFYYALPI